MNVAEHLRAGDAVIIGQTVAEPPVLVEQLLDSCRSVDQVSALVGFTANDTWLQASIGRPRIVTYVGGNVLRRLPIDMIDYLPVHASRLDDHVASGRLRADVVLLQVGPADDDGYHDLGPTVDYAWAAAQRARVVLVEVHDDMPRTQSDRRLHRSLVTASIPATRPLPTPSPRAPTAVERAVAANAAALIPDDAVIQLGLGGLAEAVAAELHGRRGLRVRSGLVGDWLVGLASAGALADGPGCVTGAMALGGPELYEFLSGNPDVEFAAGAGADADRDEPLFSVNSAVEVDLVGQAGAEFAEGRLVGGVGGQVDFFRAAHRRGSAVVALPSVTPRGATRIVPRVVGPVTSSSTDVDVVVTEYGVADIRACTASERAGRIVEVAHPEHRVRLSHALHGDAAPRVEPME